MYCSYGLTVNRCMCKRKYHSSAGMELGELYVRNLKDSQIWYWDDFVVEGKHLDLGILSYLYFEVISLKRP